MEQRTEQVQPATTSAPAPSISLSPVLVASPNNKSFLLPITLVGEGEIVGQEFKIEALIDSGAQATFLNRNYVFSASTTIRFSPWIVTY